MTNLLLATLILASATAAEFKANSVDGQTIEGRLSALDAEHVVLDTVAGRRTLRVDELMSLEPAGAPRRGGTPVPVTIRLVDGSRFGAGQFTAADGQAEASSTLGSLTIPAEAVRSVRFVEAEGTTVGEWNRLLGEDFDSDVLVVGRGESLNYHRGIVRGVSDEAVGFEIDGDVLAVKRSKVFGLIYYHPAGRTLAGTVATLGDAGGSRWSVHDMSLDGDVLKLTTPSGVPVDCPVNRLARLDFSQGKVLYLGQLKPRSVEWTPYFGLDEQLPSRRAFFAPVSGPTPDGPVLALGGKEYARGIALCSRTQVEYDLPEGYRRFTAIVGIDDAYRPHGHAELVIRADGRVLFEGVLTGTEEPRKIDLDVADVRRLSILVDFGKGMDMGDHVDLCEARLVK